MNQPNLGERVAQPTSGQYLVLMPILDIGEAQRLLPIATAVTRHHKGKLVLLSVVVVPPDQPLSDGMLEARRIRAELDAIPSFNSDDGSIHLIVNVAYSLTEGIRTATEEQQANLIILGWQANTSSPERLFGPPIDELLRQPPCDIAVARLHPDQSWKRVLLPVRGGPHTPLAAHMALALAESNDASITVLYASDPRQHDNQAARDSLSSLRTMPRVDNWIERSIPVEQAILAEAPEHQLLILGVTGRRSDPEGPIGPLADHILRRSPASVVLVRHRMAQAEEQAQQIWQQQRDLSAMVDRWFAENTFSSAEFEDVQRLVTLKQQQGLRLSLGLPALNEEATVGEIISIIKRSLMEEVPLLDELILIDSGSQDRTCEIARQLGIPVYQHQQILPQYGSFVGKGEALWKSLHVLTGDIVAWVDTDIRNFHPRFVYGLFGPLLREPNLVYCKGFYRRPLRQGEMLVEAGGWRVTELMARPLLNLFYPELSGFLQPLAGEYAARRSAIESIPFFSGYGVETGMLIDLLERYGLGTLAQVDLQQRIHRNQELLPLSKMSFAIAQVVLRRLEQRQRVRLLEPVNQNMKLIRYAENDGFQLDLREIRDHERPPIITIPEYRLQRSRRSES